MPASATAPGTLSVQAALELASTHHQAGRLAEAETVYRAVLAAHPKQADALHNLGVILTQTGRRAEALPRLKAALESRPQEPQMWLSYCDTLLQAGLADAAQQMLRQGRQYGLKGDKVDALETELGHAVSEQQHLADLESKGEHGLMANYASAQIAQHGERPWRIHALGKALLLCGRDREALGWLEKASQQLPDSVNVWNQLGLVLNHLERFTDAKTCFERALVIKPDAVDVLANLADNCNDAGQFAQAVPYCEQALAIDPKSVSARVNMANALMELQREHEALPMLEALYEEGVRHPKAMVSHALALRHTGEIDRAEALLREMLSRYPNDPDASCSLGSVLVDQGRFDEARQLLETALRYKPDLIEGWATLPATRKMTAADRPWLERAEALLHTQPNATREYMLRYAMGKFCDDTQDYDQAFAHYRRANELKKRFGQPFDRDNQQKMVDALLQYFTPEVTHRHWPGASDSERPLLIVGMPRSGTSLTEQIIASHPDTFGAGELRFWGKAGSEHKLATFAAQFDKAPLAEIAQAYLAELDGYSKEALRVVDKMPSNFLKVGLIHAVFPSARILHTMRNPVDTCLSIYFQNFNLGHTYASDLEDLAVYYRQYHRLMAHWRQVLPKGVFLELPYEQLVEDQEGWSRKIIEFIGLPWDERCLEFYKTDRKVGTASNWQARQPIYKTSKERWRNYAPYVEPLLPLLELYDPEHGQR